MKVRELFSLFFSSSQGLHCHCCPFFIVNFISAWTSSNKVFTFREHSHACWVNLPCMPVQHVRPGVSATQVVFPFSYFCFKLHKSAVYNWLNLAFLESLSIKEEQPELNTGIRSCKDLKLFWWVSDINNNIYLTSIRNHCNILMKTTVCMKFNKSKDDLTNQL